ncbi:energy coupling factor transporter S component ThiW [Lysinibacillus sp. 54212]|uniref:energy coupling factor transporter S component ThiW n=1 Tax=Lysinibacillus sp. 54212 TaxID=3119829 RepID=UPI002FCBF6B4
MNQTRKLTYTAILAAITTASSSAVYIPVGFAKIFPIQHFVNVLSAVLLGPWYAVMGAFLTSTMRNLLGTGSIFAYPGSMLGAFLAAVLYQKTKKLGYAAVGEVVGTGILGALAAYPIATLLLGQKATLFGFIPAFMMSSFAGAILGFFLLKVMVQNKAFSGMLHTKIK